MIVRHEFEDEFTNNPELCAQISSKWGQLSKIAFGPIAKRIDPLRNCWRPKRINF